MLKNRLVKLQPAQISAFWEIIRWAYMASQKVPVEQQDQVALYLLENLLAGRAECWVIYTEDEDGGRRLSASMVTSIRKDSSKGHDYLSVDAIYGLRKLTDEQVSDGILGLRAFAKLNGCEKVFIGTNVQRVKEMVLSNGFVETGTTFELDVS